MSHFCQFNASAAQMEFTWVTAIETIFFLAGLLVIAFWLAKDGPKSLSRGRELKQNAFPLSVSFGFLLGWFGLMIVAGAVVSALLGGETEQAKTIWTYLSINLVNALLLITLLIVAKKYLPEGISQLGLRFRGISRQFGWAVVNYLGAMVLVGASALLVQAVGERILGPDFKLQTHESLKSLMEHPDVLVRVVIIISVVLIIPFFEEVVFRGLLQRSLVSHFGSWSGIAATSAIFAVMHASWTHWLPIFLLGAGLGYAYQKSGSLWRPTFMHMLFNGVNVMVMLLSPELAV